MDPELDNTMSDAALDELIIENEYQRILKFYEGKDESGNAKNADTWRQQALQKARNN